MRKKKLIILSLSAIALMMTAGVAIAIAWISQLAHWNYIPPTQKKWTAADVVGTWQYPSDYPKGTLTITFNSDGTFQQTVLMSDSVNTISQTGHWAIDKNSVGKAEGFTEGYLNVYGALMNEGDKWTPNACDLWTLVDSKKSPGRLAIFGGTFPDPDVYVEFTKISSKPGK